MPHPVYAFLGLLPCNGILPAAKFTLRPSLAFSYRVAQKFGTIILYALTLPNSNRFSKLFHYQNQGKFVIILSLKIPPYLKCIATLACEMSSVLKATIENKTTSVTTHLKKLTT